MKQKRLALLTVLALLLALLAACGAAPSNSAPPSAVPDGTQGETQPSASPAPVEKTEPAPSLEPSDTAPAETPPAGQPDARKIEDTQKPADGPKPENTKPAETKPAPEPAAAPAPQAAQSAPEDGDYTAEVTLAGGSGRASIQSPAALRCTGGQFYAVIVWSSPNFDYMKVDGARYELVSAPGENSAFEIPVAAFDTPLTVIADTVAMSEPHEVEYTLTFDSASLAKQ